MLLVELSLIPAARTVLRTLIRHGQGNLGKIAEVSEATDDFERTEHILLQQSLE